MKSYTINVENETKEYISSTDERSSELGLVLQVWQDLYKIEKKNSQLTHEDFVIKKILGQILVQEYGSEENIFFPDYYKTKEK